MPTASWHKKDEKPGMGIHSTTRVLLALCGIAITTAPPPRADCSWRNYNAMLVVLAERTLVREWRAAHNAGEEQSPGINTQFAGSMQMALSNTYGHFDHAFTVAVWETNLPPPFWTKFHHHTIGLTLYDKCLRPPLGDLMFRPAPCREGSAAGMTCWTTIHKVFAIIYSPKGYDPDLTLATAHRDYFQSTIGFAIEVCLRRYWFVKFKLSAFSTCIVNEFGEPDGFTGIRGMAVIPNPLPRDNAMPYGFAGPSGQVVVSPIKMKRSDRDEAFLPDFPDNHMELTLIFGVPLLLDQL